VLDLQGLVTPEILARRDMRRRLDGTAPRAVFEFIARRRPDYLVIFPQWYPELDLQRDLFTPVHHVLLKENITNGSPLMVVYRTVWVDEPAGKSERSS
jgi:arabinofuranosyltransferase